MCIVLSDDTVEEAKIRLNKVGALTNTSGSCSGFGLAAGGGGAQCQRAE